MGGREGRAVISGRLRLPRSDPRRGTRGRGSARVVEDNPVPQIGSRQPTTPHADRGLVHRGWSPRRACACRAVGQALARSTQRRRNSVGWTRVLGRLPGPVRRLAGIVPHPEHGAPAIDLVGKRGAGTLPRRVDDLQRCRACLRRRGPWPAVGMVAGQEPNRSLPPGTLDGGDHLASALVRRGRGGALAARDSRVLGRRPERLQVDRGGIADQHALYQRRDRRHRRTPRSRLCRDRVLWSGVHGARRRHRRKHRADRRASRPGCGLARQRRVDRHSRR